MNAYYTKLIKSVGLYICVVLVISMTFVDGLGTVTSGTVGVLGKGYISLVTAKVAAKQGYKAWLAIPPGDEEEEKVVAEAVVITADMPDAMKEVAIATTNPKPSIYIFTRRVGNSRGCHCCLRLVIALQSVT